MKIDNPNLEDFYKMCPIRNVLDHLSDRWTILTMIELLKGTRRFSQLKRDIPDISPRMLSQTVRQLEQDGLVSRTVYPTIPPRVDYAMTDLGRSFVEALHPLVVWAAENHEAVLSARETYTSPASGVPSFAV